MAEPPACPDRDTWHRLLEGEIPEPEASELRRHGADCPACSQTMQLLSGDTTSLPQMAGTASVAAREEKSLPDSTQAGLASAPPPTLLRPPQEPGEIGRLGSYRIKRLISQGGMGMVYEAEDLRLGRRVALKVIRPEQAATELAQQRFLQEARAAAGIEHEHIVTIFQVDEDAGVHYLAMQFLQGEPLGDRLRREGRLAISEVLRFGKQIAEGLAAAHRHGLIHRDIKPANIFLERVAGKPYPRVKILDFGLARHTKTSGSGLTQAGLVIGTPGYMAPEQARGLPLDQRCDLFSLGCVLHHMTSGEPPFTGDDPLALLVSMTVDPVPPLTQLRPDVPMELSNLVERLLAKAADDRPATADIVVQGLTMIEQQLVQEREAAKKGTPSSIKRAETARRPEPPARPSPGSSRPAGPSGGPARSGVRDQTWSEPAKEEPASQPGAGEWESLDSVHASARRPPPDDWKSVDSLKAPAAPPARTEGKGKTGGASSEEWKSLDPVTPVPTPAPATVHRPKPATQTRPAPAAPQECPKCGKPARTMGEKVWCISCGWTNDQPDEEEKPAGAPVKLWLPMLALILLGGCIGIVVATMNYRRFMSAPGPWILWEAGLGFLVYAVGHAWLLVRTLRNLNEVDFLKYIDPTVVWRFAFEYLPSTRWPLCLGS
jgi:serine/threonine protein kinase